MSARVDNLRAAVRKLREHADDLECHADTLETRDRNREGYAPKSWLSPSSGADGAGGRPTSAGPTLASRRSPTTAHTDDTVPRGQAPGECTTAPPHDRGRRQSA